jgi:hypothetical protein
MSTKKETKTTEQSVKDLFRESAQQQLQAQQQRTYFDPLSYGTYQQLLPGGAGLLQRYLTDPRDAAMSLLGAAQAQRFIGQQGATAASQILRNLSQSGMMSNVIQPIAMQQLMQQNMYTRSGQAQALIDALREAAAFQRAAGGAALAYTPLAAGGDIAGALAGTSTERAHETAQATREAIEKMSGLGTWLPQLIGLGLGFGFGGPSFAGQIFGGVNPNAPLTRLFGWGQQAQPQQRP